MGAAMSHQANRQRARRNRQEGSDRRVVAKRDRERQAEVLIARVLSTLAQRDALVNELEERAGHCLAEIKALGWPSASLTAEACGITVREALRLRGLVADQPEAPDLSSSASNLDGLKAGE